MAEIKYKYVTIEGYNNSTNRDKVKAARNEARNWEKVYTISSIFNFLLSVAGIFSVPLGITSTVFSGATLGNTLYVGKVEDYLSDVYDTLSNNDNISYFKIVFTFKGTYQGQNKGYVYKVQGLPTHTYTYKTGNGGR